MSILISILIVLVILGVLCTIHELGHFWMARLLKIKAYEVSIFVGPKLLSWRKKGVDYSVRALPFGAYVRFSEINDEGEEVDSDDPDLLINQKRWKRLLVALAGPFMNLVLGVIILGTLFFFNGFYTLNTRLVIPDTQLARAVENCEQFEVGDEVIAVNGHSLHTSYDYFADESYLVKPNEVMVLTMKSQSTGETYELELIPEERDVTRIGITYDSGTIDEYQGWYITTIEEYQNNYNPVIQQGDIIKEIEGVNVLDKEINDVLVSFVPNQVITIKYIRDGVECESSCTMTALKVTNERGVYFDVSTGMRLGRILPSAAEAVKMPLSLVNLTVRGIESVFSGREEVYNMVSGPVGITYAVSSVVDDSTETTKGKFLDLVNFMGIISILLVFSNLLPIPGLDGIQIILIIVEMILGRRISRKAENILTIVGFVMLLSLVGMALVFDIMRISNGG